MPRIEEMYAFVVEDTGPDDEGIVGMNTGSGWMPLVGADMARVESLRPIAQAIGHQLGKKVTLVTAKTWRLSIEQYVKTMDIVTEIQELRKPTEWVKKPIDVELVEIADVMLSELVAHNAQGLAANQLGYNLRMFVMTLREYTPICVVNPVITKSRGSHEANEGCLSLPGVIVRVKKAGRGASERR